MSNRVVVEPKTGKRGRKAKPSCSTCFFGKRNLCALDLGGPCSTYRPDTPYGLIPPSQPMLLIDADRRSAAAAEPLAA